MQLVIKQLYGERGGRTILSNINFTVIGGRALLVTGSNGAGKSTLLRIIAGLLPRQSGTVTLTATATNLRSACHYLGHTNALKSALTVYENLSFWRNFYGQPRLGVDEALEAVNLEGIGYLPLGVLSTGQQRRISIAKLLVSYRPIWLLDEPTAGLDKASEDCCVALMRNHLKEGGMVLAATHLSLDLDNAETLVMRGTV